MNPDQINGWLQLGGGVLVLAALIAGWKRIWVYGWQFEQQKKEHDERVRELEKERDEWKGIALHNLRIGEKLTEVAERAVSE